MIKIYDAGALSEKDYRDIGKHLKSSGIIIYPTETSYAIGANALDNSAVQKIYALKTRDSGKPLPIIVKDLNMLFNFASVNRKEEEIISKFWPGPLTILFNAKKADKEYLFLAGFQLVGARISPHPFTLELFKEIDFPITATSANISGEESISDFKEIKGEILTRLSAFGENILLIDSKELPGGSSTIIKAAKRKIEIVREGNNNAKERLICYIKNNES
ncbi:MAG: L-threonylcarbamoyladenylate synthase [bacterium]